MSKTSSNIPFERATEWSAHKNAAGAVSGWLREPLLHFLLLGGLLFAVDHMLASKVDDPHTIVVGGEVDSEAIRVFEQTRGREPDEKELQALHQIYLDNEVLYREGLAMQVDRGDDAIRERVIFKALSVVDAGVKLPPIDDKQLREWFEQRREKYDDPARYNFQEAVLANDKSEVAVRDFVAALNAGAPGDAQAGLRVFKDRPQSNLVQSYDPEFPRTLESLPVGTWQAVQVKGTWHVLRVDSITAPKPASFESLRGMVLQDWTDAVSAEQRTAAVRALARKYKIVFEAKNNGR